MQIMKPMLMGLLLTGGWGLPQILCSQPITLVKTSGECVEIHVGVTDPFFDVLNQVQSYLHEKHVASEDVQELEKTDLANVESILNQCQYDLTLSHAGVIVKAKKAEWRNYSNSVTKEEKKELTFIVKTLGFESLISIGQKRSSLKKSGKEIDHLHPFRFLLTVFGDEELKAAIHAIRDRGGWIWSGFLDGITGSLNEEAKGQNLLQFSADFSKKVNIDHDLILPSLQQGQWADFVNILINTIPREIDPNRYNM